jgi:hypothetical protein
MNADHYTLIFDVTQSGYKSWWFPAAGLILVPCGVFVIALIKRAQGLPLEPISAAQRPFAVFILSIIALFMIAIFLVTWTDYQRGCTAMKNGTAQYLEGHVEHFVPGSKWESFDVNGIPFGYSNYDIIAGFNNTASHGGPVREGLPVHIWYRDTGRSTGNEILKLEIAGD